MAWNRNENTIKKSAVFRSKKTVVCYSLNFMYLQCRFRQLKISTLDTCYKKLEGLIKPGIQNASYIIPWPRAKKPGLPRGL